MARRRVVNWNGKDMPPEFNELPAGSYVVIECAPGDLSAEEQAGLEAGLDEIDRDETVPWEDVRAELDELLHRPR